MQFTDQVEILAKWFKDWNECEQTVALYSLLKRVKKCQAKFLCRCLEHFLIDYNDLISVEAEANNCDYVSRLLAESNKAKVIQVLLSHLPLLQPGNEAAKHSYLQVLPDVLGYAIKRSEFLEESRQLLSYSLIHPAFDNKERNMLTTFMSGLHGRSPHSNHSNLAPGEPSSETNSATNSLEPGVSLGDWKPRETDDVSPNPKKEYLGANSTMGGMGLSSPFDKPQFVTSPNPSSSSEPLAAEGMADVKQWLKTLRLHKYADLFSRMSYDEMMSLSGEDLDAKNVTKGARNKIVLSIKKLHERFALLQSLENSILTGGSLRSALQELKTIIQTPIKRFNPADRLYPPVETGNAVRREVIENGDIPSQYTRVLGKACTQLLVSKPDEENITLYLKLLERCLQHQAFTELHKRRISSWKLQVNKMYRSLPRNSRPPQSRSQPNVGYLGLRRAPRAQFLPQQRPITPRSLNPMSQSPQIRPVGVFQPQAINWFNSSFSSLPQPVLDPSRKTASLDHRLGQNLYPDSLSRVDDDSPSSEINDSLVSLCHSVAESALSDGLDGTSTL